VTTVDDLLDIPLYFNAALRHLFLPPASTPQ